jgi:hypothetical protein
MLGRPVQDRPKQRACHRFFSKRSARKAFKIRDGNFAPAGGEWNCGKNCMQLKNMPKN